MLTGIRLEKYNEPQYKTRQQIILTQTEYVK